jgi:hypothetical protein
VFDGEMVEVVLEPSVKGRARAISKASIHGLGGVVSAESKSLMLVKLPIGRLEQAASQIEGIRMIRPPLRPLFLSVTSEGVGLTGADVWQAAGFDGSGVKVAVIDGGFAGLTGAKTMGDIPTSCIGLDLTGTGLETYIDESDFHGTWVAEAVCDMAPGIQVYCIKINNEVHLENAKDYCLAQDVNIVNHSMGWFGGSNFDGQGLICDIAEAADASGILWVNSAGNYARNHWQGNFGNSGEAEDYSSYRGGAVDKPLTNFSDGTNKLYVNYMDAGQLLVAYLTWDAWAESNQDYDLLLYQDGLGLVDVSYYDQTSGDDPAELIAFPITQSGWYSLGVAKYSAARNHLLDFFVFTGGVEIENATNMIEAGSCLDPAVSAEVLAVGAIGRNNWASGPQEDFSSQGPTNGGLTKPDISGPDNCDSLMYGHRGGTSQSSPHVAGAAALVKEAKPTFTNDQIRSLLEDRARDLGAAGKDNIYGWGALDLGALVGTHTISGRVTVGPNGLAGVTLMGLGANPVTDGDGYYTAEVADGWDGTVTPQKEGYIFDPCSRDYNDVDANQVDQDYTATLLTFSIVGVVRHLGVGLGDVSMVGLPNDPCTNGAGLYIATVGYGWSGTVTPQRQGYAFDPCSRDYSYVTSSHSFQDYTAVLTYVISGTVTRDGNGLVGVEMTGLPGNPVTDADGDYSGEVVEHWGGTVTPQKEGFTFDPCDRTYVDVTSHQAVQDYNAAIIMLTISGYVDYKGDGLEDVNITGLPDTTLTDANGIYSTQVEYGWSGTVVPIRQGFEMNPLSRPYSNVDTNYPNQNYTALLTHPVWNVDTDIRYMTIQLAIDAPQTDDGHELIVDAGRTYDGTHALADFGGKQLDIHSSDANMSTVLDGLNLYGPIVTFQNCPAGTRLSGFTITRGDAVYGGGISCVSSAPTIEKCIIQANHADYYGGGIDLYMSEALITDCRIISNYASDGGGISSDLDMSTVINCEINHNTAADVGGAVQALESPLQVHNCLITDNQSTDVGGAMYIHDSDCRISNCTIANNSGFDHFGGIYCLNRTLRAEPRAKPTPTKTRSSSTVIT